ncbi:MAG: bifunctional 4-hydroxy-2-oxoglutarate aldolase/2-dehydro-3-deoxy-phosphogluconate aldolase [Candidatus Dadabacteria bacterium]|nr:bifunctional 4-hydroxy-2-oxoglutarate aldolase/2-dehydro-3-deoxy-phosphogluconate aldolase [Candidatus Dadabacteria bacterium]MDE0662983.1 bifunctional 4-hydroxy-2-oxoglutarate aldolase/2-dehydro-3-deoxy-phosphogluconate aldolase [Candidatus Dadabacteria bacterium]
MAKTTIEFMKENRVVAVIRSISYEKSLEFARGCIDGGIRIIEIISVSPGSQRLVRELASEDGICVGAGTVLDRDSAERMRDCGARFIVSPHTDPRIIEYCRESGITVVSGAFTSSEMVNARAMGADFVKIFPASSFGPGYVKAIKEPLGFMDIMVTGGITEENIRDYLSAGAALAGVSTALLGGGDDYQSIKQRAGEFSRFCT